MSKRSKAKQFKAGVENTDDIFFLLTGTRLKKVLGNAVHVFGEGLTKKLQGIFIGEEEPELPPDSPYAVLGLHPGALEVVIKGAYRLLAREYHPDTGQKPDPAKFQKATEAYNAIMRERQAESKES